MSVPAAGTDPTFAPLVTVPNRQRWTIVGLLFTASVINYFDRATISFALPLISRDLQLGPSSVDLRVRRHGEEVSLEVLRTRGQIQVSIVLTH